MPSPANTGRGLGSPGAGLTRHGITAEVRDRFVAFLQHAEPHELRRLNPRYLGERLNLSERSTLQLLVAALHEGLVNLHWEVQCPACGHSDHRASSLSDLHRRSQCAVCGTESAPRLDVEVRVTFSLHQRVRRLPPEADKPSLRAELDERLGPTPGIALLMLPEFRQLFPQQHLLPEESLEVTRVAVVFTDLAGSTALYAMRGDPRAYHLVRLHFEALRAASAEGGGVVVKTIGDSVLAAFQTPAEGLRAALEMHRLVAVLNDRENLAGQERLVLKAGLHSGPCLSVTLNDRPDYFGTTMNVAARVQALARGRDVVLTDVVRSDPDAREQLEGKTLETRLMTLKGLAEPLLVHWLRVEAA